MKLPERFVKFVGSLPNKDERYPFQGVWLNLLILLLINIWFRDAITDLKTLFAQTFYECGGLMIAWLTWKAPCKDNEAGCASTNWQVIVGESPIQGRSSEPS